MLESYYEASRSPRNRGFLGVSPPLLVVVVPVLFVVYCVLLYLLLLLWVWGSSHRLTGSGLPHKAQQAAPQAPLLLERSLL